MTCEKSKTYDLLFEKSEVSVPASYIIYCRDYPAAKVISKGNPRASSAQQGRFGKQFVGWICRQPLMKRHLVDLLRCHKFSQREHTGPRQLRGTDTDMCTNGALGPDTL